MISETRTDGKDTGLNPLKAGLSSMDAALFLLDGASEIVYLTPAVEKLLGLQSARIVGRLWDTLWGEMLVDGPGLAAEPQRMRVHARGKVVPVRAWRRSLPGTSFALVSLEDLSAEDEREREVLRILRDMQEQADDLFALYQITQFLNTATELDQLCATLLRELERITSAELGCLYLANPDGLQPKVWHGLAADPPFQPDSESARVWFEAQAGDQYVLHLPLIGESRLVGLVLLAHQQDAPREERFLHTVAKEIGTALLAMLGRQALLAQEQELEAVVASATDAIVQVDSECNVREFNPAAERLRGYSAAGALGRPCSEVLGCSGNSGCGGTCPFAHVLATRESMPYVEMSITGAEGLKHFAASISALDQGPKVAPSAVAILRDMTHQKQIEQMKSDFLATVSHELRTPLALLRGYVDTLLHLDLSPQEQGSFISGVADTTQRLEHLVEQILDVTRIEDGHMELHREPLRLVDLLRTSIMALPQEAYRSRVWADLQPDLPLMLGDPQRLEEVLINLLDNALKYSLPTGQVVVKAETSGRYIVVQVVDEGIGIPPQDQAGLFNKFQRAENARNLQVPGTGLGLFICRSIIEAHGGHIMLSSAPGSGTCVTFRVPLADEEV